MFVFCFLSWTSINLKATFYKGLSCMRHCKRCECNSKTCLWLVCCAWDAANKGKQWKSSTVESKKARSRKSLLLTTFNLTATFLERHARCKKTSARVKRLSSACLHQNIREKQQSVIQKHVLCEQLIFQEIKLRSTRKCFYMQTIMLPQNLWDITHRVI